jgi:endogenous inhibitor of DNA gyrase (YacG/DUF329 family)
MPKSNRPTIAQIAKTLNVSRRSIFYARRVQEASPAIAEAVHAGKLKMRPALFLAEEVAPIAHPEFLALLDRPKEFRAKLRLARMKVEDSNRESRDLDRLWGKWMRCSRCGERFHSRRRFEMLCSDACRQEAKGESQRRQIAKRSERRAEHRAALIVACQRCGKPVANPSRSTRAFCSNACRQAAYRGRSSTTPSLP